MSVVGVFGERSQSVVERCRCGVDVDGTVDGLPLWHDVVGQLLDDKQFVFGLQEVEVGLHLSAVLIVCDELGYVLLHLCSGLID